MSQAGIGKPVPSFSAQSTKGEISNASLKGSRAVLYFYPKDNTPGYTTEAQDFRDRHDDYAAERCLIVGISRDSLKSHENFAEKQNLPFPLVADTDETLCQLFGVIQLTNLYGKQVRGIERHTFLTEPNGTLVQAWRGLSVPG